MTPASDSISSYSMAIENETQLHVCNLHSFHIHNVHAHQWDNIQQQEKIYLFSNISKKNPAQLTLVPSYSEHIHRFWINSLQQKCSNNI